MVKFIEYSNGYSLNIKIPLMTKSNSIPMLSLTIYTQIVFCPAKNKLILYLKKKSCPKHSKNATRNHPNCNRSTNNVRQYLRDSIDFGK